MSQKTMTHDLTTISSTLKKRVEEDILNRRTPIGLDEDLFAAGFDSMCMTRMLDYVEKDFGVNIPDHEVDLDEVTTIDGWARFVHRRMTSR
jgi:D-alanine--poly(phosphoribitol) ligase subunit 2